MNGINLIPQHRLEARQRRGRVRAWVWGCGLYGATMVAGCTMAVAMFGGEDRVTSGELARMVRQATDSSRQLALVQPEMNEAKAQLDASRAVTVQPDWGLLLKLLAQTRGDAVVLDRVALSPVEPSAKSKAEDAKPAAPGNIALASAAKANAKTKRDAEVRKPLYVEIQISGKGRTQLDVSAFVLRLEQIKLFDQVKLLDTSRSGESSGVSFRLQCSMAEDLGGRKP